VHALSPSAPSGFITASPCDPLDPDALDFLVGHSRMRCDLISSENANCRIDVLLQTTHDIDRLVLISASGPAPVETPLSGTCIAPYSPDENAIVRYLHASGFITASKAGTKTAPSSGSQPPCRSPIIFSRTNQIFLNSKTVLKTATKTTLPIRIALFGR
jgi:hypothetical protein